MANAQDLSKPQVKQPKGIIRYSEPSMSANSMLGEINIYIPSVISVGDRLAMLERVDAKGTKGSFKDTETL